jgi:hypothetical protein
VVQFLPVSSIGVFAALREIIRLDPQRGWYWTEEWQKAETEVDKDLEKEECLPVFQTAEEGMEWLDK